MILPRGMVQAARPILALAAGWLVWGGAVVSCPGQVDHQGPGMPPGRPPAGLMQAEPAQAVIDTALAILEFSATEPAPAVIHTVQDTVLFGDVFHLILDFSGPTAELPGARLVAGEDWLLPVPAKKPGLLGRILGLGGDPLPEMSDLPAAEQRIRLVQSFRVYRTNPFRIQVGSFMSPVIQVRGRVAGTDEIAGIRTPRPGGWSPLVVLGLLVFFFLILLLGWLLWDRGNRTGELKDRDLPPPAWLATSIELRDLLAEGSLSRGDSRAFLDGLAGITRRFVAGRYRIAAQEMTGPEIVTACVDLGHRSMQPGIFARMIDAVDHRRYNPEASAAAWCREQAILLYDQMAMVRIGLRFSEVPADLRREGETAWVDLKRELSSGPSRLADTGALSSGPEV